MHTQKLDIEAIRSGIAGLEHVRELRYHPEVGSTNGVVSDLPEFDVKHGLVLLTDFQSAGRGRQGRSWVAPRGTSVLTSIMLEAPGPEHSADILMAAALAVTDGIRDTTGLDPTLKWPNDIMLRRRKVSGMLAESVRRGGRPFVIVGVGINVNLDADSLLDLPENATSLQVESKRVVSREHVAVALFKRLDLWYGCVTHEPDLVFASWRDRLDTLGKTITVDGAEGVWQGIAKQVRRDGGLVVQRADGRERVVYAATVSVQTSRGITSTP